jgi:hypothetical protein
MTFLVTWNFIGQDGKDYQEQTDFSIAILAPTASKFILHETNPLNLNFFFINFKYFKRMCSSLCIIHLKVVIEINCLWM